MKSKTPFRFGLAGLLISLTAFTAGCQADLLGRAAGLVGPNMNLNFVIPLGLAGTPGLLNPFGITQAVVNTLLGVSAGGSGTGASGSGSGSTYTLPPGVIPSILN